MSPKKSVQDFGLDNPLRRTETSPTPESEIKPAVGPGPDRPIGIYIPREDRAEVLRICEEINVNKHMLILYAIQYFLRDYRDGKVKLETYMLAGKVRIK